MAGNAPRPTKYLIFSVLWPNLGARSPKTWLIVDDFYCFLTISNQPNERSTNQHPILSSQTYPPVPAELGIGDDAP